MTNAASDDQCWTVEEDEKFAEFMDQFGMDIETIVLMMAHNGYHRSNEESMCVIRFFLPMLLFCG